MGKKVRINVDPMGNSKIEAEGFEGETCRDATLPFEQMFKTEGERIITGSDCAPDRGERVRG